MIPNKIHIVLISADGSIKSDIHDDGQGNLLSAPGVLSVGAVNYKLGKIQFTVASTAFNGGNYSISASVDVPGMPVYGQVANNQRNRFKLEMKNIIVVSEPDMLMGESNLVTMAMAQKSLGQNPMEALGAKLVELYTKVLNQHIVETVMASAEGDPYMIDAAAWLSGDEKFMDFNSRLNAFSSEMVNVDTELADQSVKGVEATAYLVGKNAGNWFRKMRATGEFVEQKGSTYVNDLLEFYQSIDYEGLSFLYLHL